MSHPERLNIAVFIDFDNIEIGVRTTLNEHFDPGPLLDAIKERGEVVTKIAYADWTRAGEYSRALTQHAIRLVQRNLTPGGDKNGADINLALDALEMAFTHPHINAYVIVGGDSDFLSLVEKLKQYDKKVFVVGGRQFTSIILQRNCHEFIAYENLVRKPAAARGGRPAPQVASAPIAQAVPIVRRALKILADREVSPQTGLLKSTLLQLDSTFSERNYGASSFLDFVEKLAKAGLVQLKHSGRSVMVELNETFDESAAREATVLPSPAPGPAAMPATSQDVQPLDTQPVDGPPIEGQPEMRATEPPADGVRLAGRILAAATGARWPMYLRNVKQILRAADGGFDERRYGFGGLMDLLRACQKDSLVRLERDRRGGLRVFPGAALRGAVPQPSPFDARPSAPTAASRGEDPFVPYEAVDADVEESAVPEPHPIDTTAQLLGTRPRKARAAGRARVNGAAAVPRATRKTGAKKAPTARRSTRGRKPPASEATGDTDNS